MWLYSKAMQFMWAAFSKTEHIFCMFYYFYILSIFFFISSVYSLFWAVFFVVVKMSLRKKNASDTLNKILKN